MNQRESILNRCFDMGVKPWAMGGSLYLGSPQLRIPIIKLGEAEIKLYAKKKRKREAEEAEAVQQRKLDNS